MLTVAERRILALAAEGLSNRQIDRALCYTCYSTSISLARIYRKLGIAPGKPRARRRRAIWLYFTGEALG